MVPLLLKTRLADGVLQSETAPAKSGVFALKHVTSTAQAEAHACEDAVHAAAEWGMIYVIIESDAQNLVRALQHGSDFDRSPEGVIYRDIRLYMQLHFNTFEFVYVPRTVIT
jgi:ribonuclease HI